MLLQVSTTENIYAGQETNSGPALGKWSHLVFSFQNHTAEGASKGDPQYSYEMFLDGVSSARIEFFDKVLSNDHPLMVGFAPGVPGPPMIVSKLLLYEKALGGAEATVLYKRHSKYHNEGAVWHEAFVANGLNAIGTADLAIAYTGAPSTPGLGESIIAEAKSLLNDDCKDVKKRLILWQDAAREGIPEAALMAGEVRGMRMQ